MDALVADFFESEVCLRPAARSHLLDWAKAASTTQDERVWYGLRFHVRFRSGLVEVVRLSDLVSSVCSASEFHQEVLRPLLFLPGPPTRGVVVLQGIVVQWNKDARGGEGASRRAGVSEAYPLAPPEWPETGQVIEYISCRAREEFRPTLCRRTVGTEFRPLRYGDVRVVPSGPFVRVFYEYEMGGLPLRVRADAAGSRVPLRHELPAIEKNQWVRVVYNGRHQDFDDGTWWYEQCSVNVGFFEKPPNTNVFVATAPVQRYDQLARLF